MYTLLFLVCVCFHLVSGGAAQAGQDQSGEAVPGCPKTGSGAIVDTSKCYSSHIVFPQIHVHVDTPFV